MINPVSSAHAAAVSTPQAQPRPAEPPKAASPESNIGPAVVVSLSNAAKPDMAQGDPDHDGE